MASARRDPNREIEVKLRVGDLPLLVRKLHQLGAQRKGTVFEQNSLFDTPDRGLSRRGAILRIRSVIPAPAPGQSRQRKTARTTREGILTFKGLLPGHHGARAKYKIREEIEFRLRDAARFERLLRRLGLVTWFRYEKYRTRYSLPHLADLHLDLDETPIGTFLELEGPPRAIDAAARALGYSRRLYVAVSYLELYLADCRRRRVRPGDMVFNTKKSFI